MKFNDPKPRPSHRTRCNRAIKLAFITGFLCFSLPLLLYFLFPFFPLLSLSSCFTRVHEKILSLTARTRAFKRNSFLPRANLINNIYGVAFFGRFLILSVSISVVSRSVTFHRFSREERIKTEKNHLYEREKSRRGARNVDCRWEESDDELNARRVAISFQRQTSGSRETQSVADSHNLSARSWYIFFFVLSETKEAATNIVSLNWRRLNGQPPLFHFSNWFIYLAISSFVLRWNTSIFNVVPITRHTPILHLPDF